MLKLKHIFVSILVTHGGFSVASAQTETARSSGSGLPHVPAALVQLGSGEYYSPYAFVVDKKARKLSVWNQKNQGLSEVATFPIDMGRGGGNKKKHGDLNTPEGIYFLMDKLEGPSLDFKQYGLRAFTTDYPNLFDEREGKTGNGIWLHAVPDDTPLTRGSRGCVVVRNEVILDISKYVNLRQTPILIFDEVPSMSHTERTQTLQTLKDRLEGWRAAWESKNLSSYMDFYSSSFESLKMNKNRWRNFKSTLNDSYESIQVRLSNPVIYRDNDRMVMRFLQAYQSDRKADYGEKTLYWRQESGQWTIVAEQWRQVTNPIAYHELTPFASSETAQICTNCEAEESAGGPVSSTRTPASASVRN